MCRFNHQGRITEGRDDSITHGEVMSPRRDPRPEFTQQEPFACHAFRELADRPGLIHTRTQHRNSCTALIKDCLMCDAIHAPGQTADHNASRPGEGSRKTLGLVTPVTGRRSGPHHRHPWPQLLELMLTSGPKCLHRWVQTNEPLQGLCPVIWRSLPSLNALHKGTDDRNLRRLHLSD